MLLLLFQIREKLILLCLQARIYVDIVSIRAKHITAGELAQIGLLNGDQFFHRPKLSRSGAS
jgi:hypothetical protein